MNTLSNNSYSNYNYYLHIYIPPTQGIVSFTYTPYIYNYIYIYKPFNI